MSKALKAIGPGAEAAVIPFLQVHDRATDLEACRILAEIGTDKSVQPLTQVRNIHLRAGWNDIGMYNEMRVWRRKRSWRESDRTRVYSIRCKSLRVRSGKQNEQHGSQGSVPIVLA